MHRIRKQPTRRHNHRRRHRRHANTGHRICGDATVTAKDHIVREGSGDRRTKRNSYGTGLTWKNCVRATAHHGIWSRSIGSTGQRQTAGVDNKILELIRLANRDRSEIQSAGGHQQMRRIGNHNEIILDVGRHANRARHNQPDCVGPGRIGVANACRVNIGNHSVAKTPTALVDGTG